MIQINKSESEKIKEKYPYASIVRSCIQKSKRHRYYLPEEIKYLKLISDVNVGAAKVLKEKQIAQKHNTY